MERITKYEQARMVGARALQISMGAPFLIKLSEEELEKLHYNPVEIAKREFAEGVLPMAIRKVLPTVRAVKTLEAKAAA
ncbi:DNA-directed RNA polymerase subunit K [Candidatus Woesearchaeota archaeon]|nr:DNA-directed RNA polymerase subunit K [Candidatus Woesearchaeota archaeon]